MFNNPDPASVHKLLTSLTTGKRTGLVDESAFYAASFSGNNARAVVRDWLDTTVGKAKASIGRWFQMQRIVGMYGEAPFSTERNRPLSLYWLATATVRDAKDIQRETTTALVRAALLGAPIPLYLLQAVINRCRAERNVNLRQATLIKMVLMSHNDKFKNPDFNEEDDLMVALNPNADTAFQCGRLLSVLENAQLSAIPGIKATLVDRFYGAASSTPATAFPPLLRTLQNHLGKLERDKRGAYVRLQEELEEIMGRIGAQFPRTLTLQQQGEFALGYYHQRAHNRARIGEAAERKREANSPTDEPDETEE
jgi:CRISPR-associated protein Csd1